MFTNFIISSYNLLMESTNLTMSHSNGRRRAYLDPFTTALLKNIVFEIYNVVSVTECMPNH